MSAQAQSDQAAGAAKVSIPPLTGVYAEPFSGRKLLKLMGFFGPAAVVTSISLGAGETIMVTGLGAWAEYDMLWLLLLSVLVKGIFVTYLVGRYTAVTGQPIGNRLVMLPGPRGWLLIAVVVGEAAVISTGLTAVAKPCGNLVAFLLSDSLPGTVGTTEWTFQTWENVFASLLIAGALAFSLFCTYAVIEKQQIFICGLLMAGTVVASLMVGPDWGRLVTGALQFGHMATPPDWAPPAAREHYILNLVTIFGYVGGSLSGYLAYSNWVSLHGWGINSHPEIDRIRRLAERGPRIDYLPDDPQAAGRLRVLLTPLRWDVGMGAIVLFFVTAAFMTSGAAVLYPRQEPLPGDAFELLTKQASIWTQIHEALAPLYYVAVLAALWGTLASVPEAISRVIHSFLSAVWPSFAAVSLWRVRLFLAVWFFATSQVWIWTGITFDLLTQVGAFLTLNLGVSVICLCVVYFNATLPRRYRPRWWVLAGGGASAVVLVLCAAGSALGLWSKFSQG